MEKRSAPRRATLAFVGCCAGVLAAGMALVGAAGLSTPGRQVGSRPALPVYSALGAESADVQFWPWQLWEEAKNTENGAYFWQEASGELAAPWLNLFDWGMGQGANASSGRVYMALPEDGDCLYVRAIRFTDTPPQIAGLSTPNAVQQELTAEFAAGYRSSGFAVSCLVYAADGYQDLPGDWQETAVQRCREELLYLFNLSNDDQRVQLYHRLNSMLTPFPWALEDASFPLGSLENYWQGMGRDQLAGMLGGLQGMVRSAQYNSLVLYSDGGWQEPGESWGCLYNHQPLYADPMPGEAELARVLADVSLDVQIVPLEKQVMVLFGWYGGNLAVYYDPVLDCFSGYALQQ
ncbi:hypothetical protein [Candidatus Allofournierella excrementigallinarum]|uniref:hypothetical protein n=1 Tax=Candidatus Allofournierella excrementigallinarum TaxID=2838592 RepID=UPI00374F4AA6